MINWYKKFRISQAVNPDDELIQELSRDSWQDVQSSFIDAIAYYELAEVLEVRLQTGKIYTFMGVPKKVYEDFMKSGSKGEYFNNVIRKYKVQ